MSALNVWAYLISHLAFGFVLGYAVHVVREYFLVN